MGDLIRSDQSSFRYLREPGDGSGSFTRFLEKLDVALPQARRVQKLVEWGYLVPRLRLRIPNEFLIAWENYPVIDFKGSFADEHSWAFLAYGRLDDQLPSRAMAEPVSDRWFEHPLDDRSDPEIRDLWDRATKSEDLKHPNEPISHPRGFQTYPFVDWFAYWQAYYLQELEEDLRLFQPVENIPDAHDSISNMLERFDTHRKDSDGRIRRTRERWRLREPIFDWLSRYRVLVGNWALTGLPGEALHEATVTLAAEQSLTEDRIRSDVRDGLLTMWREWTGLYSKRYFSPELYDLLREDIQHGFRVLAAVSGKAVETRDPYFDPPDRTPRAWSRPREVLPFEAQKACDDFPLVTPHLLRYANRFLPPKKRFDEAKLSSRIDAWWKDVPAFRRFCINIYRLNRHYAAASGDERVILEEPTVVDYLLLTSLSAERILLHLYLGGRRRSAPDFQKLLKAACTRITRSLCMFSIWSHVQKEQTSLYGLTRSPTNPFSAARGLPKGSLKELLTASFVDFAVMRHYAAHHDAIDDELVGLSWGAEPLSAIVLVTLLAMDS